MNLPTIYDGSALPQPISAGNLLPGAPIAPDEDDRLSFARLLGFFRRRSGIIWAVLGATLLLGGIITALQPRLYTASAVLLLKPQSEQLEDRVATKTQPQQQVSGDWDMNTQLSVITSTDVARRVMETLKLDRDPRYNPELAIEPTLFESLTGAKPRALAPSAISAENMERGRRAIVQDLKGSISAQQIGTSYSLSLTVQDTDPQMAAGIANAFAGQYAQSQVSDKQQSAQQAMTFLERKIAELRTQAQNDFAAVQSYRIRNGLLSNQATSLTEQDISVYNQQVATAKAEAAADQAQLATARRQLRAGSNGSDVGEALSSTVVGSLRTQRSQIAARVADLSARYGSKHPELLRARQELAAVDQQIQEEIDRVISNLEAKVNVSGQRLGSLQGSLGQARGVLASNNGAMVALDDLQRRAEASQGQYETYLARYRQISAMSGTEQSRAKVISEATAPSGPSSPRVMLNMILAGIVGLLLGGAIAFVVEMQFSGLTTSEDVAKALGLPFLGSVPDNRKLDGASQTPFETVVDQPSSIMAEAVRGIYSATHMHVPDRGRVLAITSAMPDEGKTSLAAMLAHTAAGLGVNTVVVDCDVIVRGLSKLFQATDGQGLREAIAGTATLDLALHEVRPKLTVLPLVSVATDGERLTADGGIHRIVAQLKERFELVVLDLPPLLSIAETREIAGLADGVAMAVRWRATSRDRVKAATRLLPVRLRDYLGVVLTRVDLKKQAKFAPDEASSGYYDAYAAYLIGAR
ncbi:polysaccharide biosynthesis tyrosine autokinase [Novosphingobium sp. KCTC 2891]|uniref:GumC family protein n=1 Tax=Novosphingobium sp. KCTC 2891 TaxID=2989730 RepID=UPI002221BDAC|nr:polysaccharide biosynthesis tyrosine autokinase [Novosphingobium sp. KCTC 2891]MCW1382716.1 polysaccharide biosynthesis tyrosine autokinase [Novosphingobium sp. KCTC 2891]